MATMRTLTAMATLSKAEVKIEIFVTMRLGVSVSMRALLVDNLVLLAVTRGTLLMNDGVLLAIERGNFALGRGEAMRASTTDRALLIAKSFVDLAAEDSPLVSTVKIDVLDLVVLTEFNISAWNISSSNGAVTVSVTNTVAVVVMAVAVVMVAVVAVTVAAMAVIVMAVAMVMMAVVAVTVAVAVVMMAVAMVMMAVVAVTVAVLSEVRSVRSVSKTLDAGNRF